MFDIGFWEIALIGVLALVILGPERLPHAARTVGNFVGKARRYIEGVKSEVEKEFDTGELKRMLHNQEVQIRELQGQVSGTANEFKDTYDNIASDDDPGNSHQENNSDYEVFEENSDGYDELAVTQKSSNEEVDNETSEEQTVLQTHSASTDKSV